jgi:putative aldouronate transport system permease protein
MGYKSLKNIAYNVKRGWMLYLLLIPPLIYLIIFRYLPMYGITIAFKDFNPIAGFFSPESPWVGLDNFKEIFSSDDFPMALRNTLLLNFLDLLFSFPAPIILALLLNELRYRRFKRVSQTLLYLPYFLSWAIIGGIVYRVFSSQHGMINTMLGSLGLEEPIPFLMESVPWIVTYLVTGIWQSAGWGTILYLAAISGINLELYDAAKVDGAGRLRSMWHITLPGIRPTIAILLVLSIGRVITIPFDRPYILGNVLVRDVADVISTYVYRVGIQVGRFSIATAVGLFQSVVGMVLVFTSNFLTKKFWGHGIW